MRPGRTCSECGAAVPGWVCWPCSAKRDAYFVHAMRLPSGEVCGCASCVAFREARELRRVG